MRLYKFHAIFPLGGAVIFFAPEGHNMMALIGFIFREGIRPHVYHIVESLYQLEVGDIFEIPSTELQDCYVTLVEIEGNPL